MKSMIAFILVSMTLIAGTASAKIDYTTGTGYASGSCAGGNSFCLRSLQGRAESSAKQNAATTCTIHQGNPKEYTVSCSSRCSPSYIPPNSTVWVNCSASCRMQCEYKD